MNNYKKDKSYIKQRLEYVSPVDYISELEGKIEYLEYLKNENERLNGALDQADNKNLELIEMINKIYDIIENDNITGIEARLMIQDVLDKESE